MRRIACTCNNSPARPVDFFDDALSGGDMDSIRYAAFALLALGASPLSAEPTAVEFSSGDDRVTLIELYTSEGCSSCPPAERWLNSLKSEPGLFEDFVPVALHVDYWDYLGWKDRFANSRYSDRQRRYAAEGAARSVYTPGVFADGQAWLGWRKGQSIASQPATPGKLAMQVDGRDIAVTFSPSGEEYGDLVLYVVVLGMGFETQVRAGENRGRTLTHDFVALAMRSTPLELIEEHFTADTRLPKVTVTPDELALVAWVAERGSQAPIQAVGGYLPGGS